jgi:NADH-quinone oxidoreductase subunit J
MDISLNAALFYALAGITGASAVAVVVTQNIVRAATWLLFALAGAAGIYFLLGADFLGATQLLIYVGGTLVLVVFGVMLTAQGPFINMRISAAEWFISMIAGFFLFGALAVSLANREPLPPEVARKTARQEAREKAEEAPPKRKELLGSRHLGASLLGDRTATPTAYITGVRFKPGPVSSDQGKAKGAPKKAQAKAQEREPQERTRTQVAYLLPFEIVSVHLLVVLVGAAYLARAKRRRGAA